MSFIETERLIVRTWMHSDIESVAALMADADVMRFIPGGVRAREVAVAWMDRAIEEQDREGFSLWPVVRRSDGRVIGYCGLHRMPDGAVEIAWIFERAAWGFGYATEAARAVLDYARENTHVRGIVALIDPWNRASIALAGRLGLRFDRLVRAYKRDLLRYLVVDPAS
ncbi:MAG TPA: GNAT family N-acetyltransferase [Candidatus Baltobacteraceae bacterium]|nr:GNAT family N-acetyltransferase [Candidatus Baltobacteraceae bacterium]